MFDRDLLIRLALGLPCLGLAFWMVQREPDPYIGMLGSFPCLLACALIIYPSSTTVAANAWASLFLPDKNARPRPEVDHAQQLRFHSRFEESLAALAIQQQILVADPEVHHVGIVLAQTLDRAANRSSVAQQANVLAVEIV